MSTQIADCSSSSLHHCGASTVARVCFHGETEAPRELVRVKSAMLSVSVSAAGLRRCPSRVAQCCVSQCRCTSSAFVSASFGRGRACAAWVLASPFAAAMAGQRAPTVPMDVGQFELIVQSAVDACDEEAPAETSKVLEALICEPQDQGQRKQWLAACTALGFQPHAETLWLYLRSTVLTSRRDLAPCFARAWIGVLSDDLEKDAEVATDLLRTAAACTTDTAEETTQLMRQLLSVG